MSDDPNLMKIMISTDNHLGFNEKDPVRCGDSFAAFEEVLFLAKANKCDMVLLAGDLFHDNKPSRRTLMRTMQLLRKYCMGSNAVSIEVVSEQSGNFRGTGRVNYEDENYSVDLPVFAIHGNHDDPTREGGNEMLAALDLLAASNLVNYFGRQDEVDKVEVSPVLIRKGTSNIALYGMGSMRDERLNRMWTKKKVKFLRPEDGQGTGTPSKKGGGGRRGRDEDDEDGEEEQRSDWFNIFALHQNRDAGRGSKNCVHESMIPEWMDLVIWGHEHECMIHPAESLVGTFMISQPGSSVATSLSDGEAVKKQVAILEISGIQFRMNPIPLSRVRSFAIGELTLSANKSLNPEDPKIDEKVSKILSDRVHELILEAQEKSKDVMAESAESRVVSGEYDDEAYDNLTAILEPKQVLVRLRVDHSGFTTLNPQRFGQKFVGQVANPADILLFARRKKPQEVSGKSKGGAGSSKASAALDQPFKPEDMLEINVEDLIKDNLEMADKKLEILDEATMCSALEEFVAKSVPSALHDAVTSKLKMSQTSLFKRGAAGSKIDSAAAVREVCASEAEKQRQLAAEERERQEKSDDQSAVRRRLLQAGRSAVREPQGRGEDDGANMDEENYSGSDNDNNDFGGSKKKAPAARKPAATKAAPAKAAKVPSKKAKTSYDDDLDDGDGSDDDVQASTPAKRSGRNAGKEKKSYADAGNDDEEEVEVLDIDASDDDEPASKKKAPAKKAPAKETPAAAKRKAAAAEASSSKRSKQVQNIDDDDDDGDEAPANKLKWGSSQSQNQSAPAAAKGRGGKK